MSNLEQPEVLGEAKQADIETSPAYQPYDHIAAYRYLVEQGIGVRQPKLVDDPIVDTKGFNPPQALDS
jgi:hypothetical protein